MLKWGFLFIAVPLIELFILLQLGKFVGIVPTFGIIFLTAVIGAYLTRLQGLGILRSIQNSLQQGLMPTKEIMDGLCILVAGAFLLTPGFFTDLLGFLLLVPPFRRHIQGYLQYRFEKSMTRQMIEIEYGESPRPRKPL